jgi:hypothetical protein
MNIKVRRKIVIAGELTPFARSLKKTLEEVGIDTTLTGDDDFESEILKQDPRTCIIILNTTTKFMSQISEWLWNKLRLNELQLGKERSGIPVLAMVFNKNFLETPEGKVFSDFPAHHQYIIKPIRLDELFIKLDKLHPINPLSLSVIKDDVPDNLLAVLEHDLAGISKTFNFNGSASEIKKRFKKVEINFKNYCSLQKNRVKLNRMKREIENLRKKVLNE